MKKMKSEKVIRGNLTEKLREINILFKLQIYVMLFDF